MIQHRVECCQLVIIIGQSIKNQTCSIQTDGNQLWVYCPRDWCRSMQCSAGNFFSRSIKSVFSNLLTYDQCNLVIHDCCRHRPKTSSLNIWIYQIPIHKLTMLLIQSCSRATLPFTKQWDGVTPPQQNIWWRQAVISKLLTWWVHIRSLQFFWLFSLVYCPQPSHP